MSSRKLSTSISLFFTDLMRDDLNEKSDVSLCVLVTSASPTCSTLTPTFIMNEIFACAASMRDMASELLTR